MQRSTEKKNLVTGRKGLARNIRALEELPKKDRLDIVKEVSCL